MKRTSVIALAMTASAATFLAAAPANAAVVPNMMGCTRNGGHCFQVNGPYNANVPTECFWTNRTGPYALYYTLCDYWMATPRGY